MMILLLKCKVPDQRPHPSIQKNKPLCKRRLKYTDCHTRIFMSQINSSLVSKCRWKEAMWLSQEVVWNAAVNLEA